MMSPLETAVVEAAIAYVAAPSREALTLLTETTRRVASVRAHAEYEKQLSTPEQISAPYSRVATGPRQTGKTYAACEWVRAGRKPVFDGSGKSTNNRVLFVGTQQRANDLVHQGLLNKSEVEGYNVGRGIRDRTREYAVDEAGEFIAQALGMNSTPALINVCTEQ